MPNNDISWNANGIFSGSVTGSSLILQSSTEDSDKKFELTINDQGVIQVAPFGSYETTVNAHITYYGGDNDSNASGDE